MQSKFYTALAREADNSSRDVIAQYMTDEDATFAAVLTTPGAHGFEVVLGEFGRERPSNEITVHTLDVEYVTDSASEALMHFKDLAERWF